MARWTPTPDTLRGVTLPYSESMTSGISQSEGFKRGLNIRDGNQCIICGAQNSVIEHCHIVPKSEHSAWDDIRKWGVIPWRSKNVDTEARNGIKMCRNHQGSFENHEFFIRWMPADRRFVFINHSRTKELEAYHGRAVRLYPDDPRTPFYGVFLNQEMRVRGRYPYQPQYSDRPIVLPIPWQKWIRDAPGMNPGGSGNGNEGDDSGSDGNNHAWNPDNSCMVEEETDTDGSAKVILGGNSPSLPSGWVQVGQQADTIQTNAHISYQSALNQPHPPKVHRQQGGTHGNTTGTASIPAKTTIIFTDPMANPGECELLVRAARQEPNWRAAIIEGEAWDGTTEENIAHYLRAMEE